MKIAFFVWEYQPRIVGGLGIYATELTKKYKELGHEVTVFTVNDGSLPAHEEIDGVEVNRPFTIKNDPTFPLLMREDLRSWGESIKLFEGIFSYNYISASIFVNQLVKESKKEFDVLAYHDWLSAFSGLIIQKELGIPTCFHVHSTEEQRSFWGGSQTIRDIEKLSANNAEKIITVSNSMKDFLLSLNYPKEKVNAVWNGIDANKYDPKKVDKNLVAKLKSEYKIKEQDRVLFFIGRLTGVKGVANLVKSMPSVLKDFPNTKLVIVGIGEEYGNVMSLSESLGLGDKMVIKSEWLPDKEKLAHFGLADVCVFPSLSEPFGIVGLEGMAMKKPVVVGASGINGLKEQIVPSGDDRSGVHVDGNKPEDIAWGIKEVLKNPDEAKKWGANGRMRVLEDFTLDATAKKTLRIYGELAK
jgi:glycosyltransferase involved in cell wall biosynthesis